MDLNSYIAPLLDSIVYSVMGLLWMFLAVAVADKMFKINFRKEVLQEHNSSVGILFAGISIAIGIIIAAAIR